MVDDPPNSNEAAGADENVQAPTTATVDEVARACEESGRPYARVTVVRREPPVSANVGDRALVTREGDVVGWVGGADCAQWVVVREATAAIDRDEPVLLGLAPDPEDVDRPGLEAFPMTCHSGGVLELFVEPVLPGPELVVVGDSPIARAVTRLGTEIADGVTVVTGADEDVDVASAGEHAASASDDAASAGEHAATASDDVASVVRDAVVDEDSAGEPDTVDTVRAADPDTVADAVAGAESVVVASMGERDALGVEAGLRAGADYVGLVASDRRRDDVAETVAGRTDADEDAVVRAVTTPAGLDISARRPEEIAVSVLAELVALRRDADDPIPIDVGDTTAVDVGRESSDRAERAERQTQEQRDGDATVDSEPSTVTDPVCGMAVAVDDDTPAVDLEGETYHFCGQGCADAFAEDPDRYADAGVGGGD